MGYRYIGSKARIVNEIMEYIGKPTANDGYFIDAFSGTGVVADKAASKGWKVHINDMLKNAITMSEARLLAVSDVPFENIGSYEAAIQILNNQMGIEGFIWKEYSPASMAYCGIERRYFTEDNAQKIDAVVTTIHNWKNTGIITDKEFTLLMMDVFSAVNAVANIAGTYGCFLATWTSQANTSFTLEMTKLRRQPVEYSVSNIDVFEIESKPSDTIYFDPPYTKRQYASYYHILETIVCGDQPIVEGVSGLRPWRNKASVFCYKVKALKALSTLILNQRAKRVILSYSNEGHIVLNDLIALLAPHGQVNLVEIGKVGRYRPNRTAVEKDSEVNEYIIDFQRE